MVSPNIIAYAALLLSPFVVWQLFRRLDPARALICTVLGSYMFLPTLTEIDLPVVPNFNKDTLPMLTALFCTIFMLRDRFSVLPENIIGKLLVLMLIISPFFTVLTNGDPIFFTQAEPIPGMRIYDSFAAVTNSVIYALPLFLGRKYLATPEAAETLLRALVVAVLVYSPLMLIESRLSPQLNVWIYGYFQHDFAQTIRQGGFRPVVFMPHGLWVAMFVLICLGAAAVFLRQSQAADRPKHLAIFLYACLMLQICKSAGVTVYAIAMVPLILFAPRRLQVIFAALLAVIVIAYPILRGAHLVPLEPILEYARGLSADRAWSLEYRIINEELLLARAEERPWFGWGGYARNFIHDLITGERTTVADGTWVLQIGTYGWLGYIALFGLLCLPLWLLAREALSKTITPFPLSVATLALIFAFNMIDLLPNATLVPLSWLIAGALLGNAEALRAQRIARRLARLPKSVQTVI